MKSERKKGRRHRLAFASLAAAALGAAIPTAAEPSLTLRETAIAAHRYGVAAVWPHFALVRVPTGRDRKPRDHPAPATDPARSPHTGTPNTPPPATTPPRLKPAASPAVEAGAPSPSAPASAS